VLWALGQPAAAVGLVVAFLLGLGVRGLAQRVCLRLLGSPVALRPRPRTDVEPVGAVAVLLGGTGWGRPPLSGPRRRALVLAAGPVAVLLLSQLALAAFCVAYPHDREALRLNRPSDVLRGVIAPTMAEQLVLSVAVGLLCFGLLALVPLPPLDGYRLLRLFVGGREPSVVAERIGVVVLLVLLLVPVGGVPPLLTVLDLVGAPVMGGWA
jgi:Zn-dependent protease